MAKIKIKQIGSPIRRPESQKKILIGLGLGKMHRVVELEDTAEVRGAIKKLPTWWKWSRAKPFRSDEMKRKRGKPLFRFFSGSANGRFL